MVVYIWGVKKSRHGSVVSCTVYNYKTGEFLLYTHFWHMSETFGNQQQDRSAGWQNLFNRVRSEAASLVEYGATFGKLASLIALGGLLYWCPRCGQWMGEGSEGQGPAAPAQAPPVPQRLLRAISSPLVDQPTPTADLPARDGGKLTPNSGVLETHGMFKDTDSKIRHRPPSYAHGRRVENLYDGSPRPDSYPHGHEITYVRGDGERLPIYDRLRDGTVVYDNGMSVVYKMEDNVYEWTLIPPTGGESNQGDG